MFGRKKIKSPDAHGCPRCGKPLMAQSGIARCGDCGTINADLWGHRGDAAPSVVQKPDSNSGWDWAGGYRRQVVRYEKDEDNQGEIGDRPGRIDRELDE